MELKYIILTIIKILISVPTIVMVTDNSANITAGVTTANLTNALEFKIDVINEDALNSSETREASISTVALNISEPVFSTSEEQIPDPSALVVPGYNLPESIFNKGKPFYLERDPITGQIDFNSKTPLPKLYDDDDDEYEYSDDEQPNYYDIHDKANINRKDGNIGSHKPSDINQLTPNFHDFLNLPVKYNPAKYVYPLISSSYANTKVQGNVNKIHNHKDYSITTYKPMFFATTKSYFGSTTAIKPITKRVTYGTLTTKKTMSLFEQLFGDYDEEVTATVAITEPTTIKHEIYNGNKITNGHMAQEENILADGNMAYEYEDDNIMVATKKGPLLIEVTTPTEDLESTTKSSYQVSEVDFQDGVDVTKHALGNKVTTMIAVDKVVTSLPIGDNHVTQKQPIIVATHNLREQLASEKVDGAKPFGKIPNQSNVLIAPDQDIVSFVVGHHQNVAPINPIEGQYHGTALKESPYDSNPFRPVYGIQNPPPPESTNYNTIIQVHKEDVYYPADDDDGKVPQVTIHPIHSSEANLAIGDPIQDELLQETIDFLPTIGSKIVFPTDQILQLHSKPLFHQLPSDLTPPIREQSTIIKPAKLDRVRPPWDPRPGHFHLGRPEYARPPRPPPTHANSYKQRIDTLPNILPQFRPNHHRIAADHHRQKINYVRQALLERPSHNRPIGFFEKLHPPLPPQQQQQVVVPPSVPKSLQSMRKVPALESEMKLRQKHAEDRIMNLNMNANSKGVVEEPLFGFLSAPPTVVLLNGLDDAEVATLQMIQAAKLADEKQQRPPNGTKNIIKANVNGKDTLTLEKPLYVVYPVNTPPLKLLDNKKDSAVVIGTRTELPLPPSKISTDTSSKEFNFEQNDRHDSPILKPHARPTSSSTYPIVKSDFPYALERPDPSILNPPVPDSPNNLDAQQDDTMLLGNQWIDTIDPLHNSKGQLNTNQISATLKTFAQNEKPIAVAYTPTEPTPTTNDKYSSMPNYAIAKIRSTNKDSSEFTVSAVMHAHAHNQNVDLATQNMAFIGRNQQLIDDLTDPANNRIVSPQQDFQAPFQASANLDGVNNPSQGWAVINRHKDDSTGTTIVVPLVPTTMTTKEFDIENFKPQLEGGFKPIYSYAGDGVGGNNGIRKEGHMQVSEREEK